MAKRLYVVPILNTMGPVTDARHTDLLNTWEEVDRATASYFTDRFRNTIIDQQGRPVSISWFPVSWSGFETNPVERDFGWFTIYDHINQRWKADMDRFGDGIYWMYNHPDKSGVGNAWGLDWLHNCHYLKILNRMVVQRGFFPGVVEIPTANNHSSHFVEQYFPFDISNRNSPFINWDNIEADGRKTREILQWADAPNNWIPYHPSESNHQCPGEMKHAIFRLLDIKTRIMYFPQDEVIKAFDDCRAGHDVVIAGYEHDFRDRCDAVIDLFLEPIKIVARDYPDVEVINANLQTAAIECLHLNNAKSAGPRFSVELKKDYVCIQSDTDLFGPTPYVAIEDFSTGEILSCNPFVAGYRSWGIQLNFIPGQGKLGIAGFSRAGIQRVSCYLINDLSFQLIDEGN
ncbi:MAG: hypothetical protein KJ950_15140 [Proteobacteria bacterium]|nr:hypothetical protein [Pseudomonadota bacterium]MBU1688671.1 hypothetical protein [Pseudomonadota bacterium]